MANGLTEETCSNLVYFAFVATMVSVNGCQHWVWKVPIGELQLIFMIHKRCSKYVSGVAVSTGNKYTQGEASKVNNSLYLLYFRNCLLWVYHLFTWPLPSGALRIQSLPTVQAPTETCISLQKRTPTPRVTGPGRPWDKYTLCPGNFCPHDCCSAMCPRAQNCMEALQWVSGVGLRILVFRALEFGIWYWEFRFQVHSKIGEVPLLIKVPLLTHSLTTQGKPNFFKKLLVNHFNRKRRIYVL